MAIQIRESAYRGREGFTITGRVRPQSWPVRIFTETRSSAEHIRRKIKAGLQTELADFQPQE